MGKEETACKKGRGVLMKAGTTPNRKRFHVRSLRNFFGGSVAFVRAAPPRWAAHGREGTHTRFVSSVYIHPFLLAPGRRLFRPPAPDDRGAGVRPVNELC